MDQAHFVSRGCRAKGTASKGSKVVSILQGNSAYLDTINDENG